MSINYITGNLFEHLDRDSVMVIPHVCNNIGGWGSGFVVPLSRAFPESEEKYRSINASELRLGDVQFIRGRNKPCIFIANMIAQNGVTGKNNPHPLIYDALSKSMKRITYFINDMKLILGSKKIEILAPQFGCGLAGGKWENVEKMIEKYWLPYCDVTVFKYDG